MFIKSSIAKVSRDPIVTKWNSLRKRIVGFAIMEFIKDKRNEWDAFYSNNNIIRSKKKGYLHKDILKALHSRKLEIEEVLKKFDDIIYSSGGRRIVLQVNEPGVKKFLSKHNLTFDDAYADKRLHPYISKTIKAEQFTGLMTKLKNAKEGEEIKCTYCDNPINFAKSMSALDRLSQNYTPGTLVPCCYDCNLLKGKYSPDKFISLVYKIQENLKTKEIKDSKSPAFVNKINEVDNLLGIVKEINNVNQHVEQQIKSTEQPEEEEFDGLQSTQDETTSENNEQILWPFQTKTSSLKKRIKKISKLLKSSLDNSRTHKHSSSKSIRYNKLQEIFKAAQGVLPEVYHADEPDQESERWDTRAEVGDEYERRLELLRQWAEEEAREDHPLEPKDDPSFIPDTLRRPFDKDDQDVLDDDIPF